MAERFRKKPVVVEAMQYRVGNLIEVVAFLGDQQFEPGIRGFTIKTLEGDMLAEPGDWIIKEPFPSADRRFYPCKPDRFEQTYEPVEAPRG
jgi:hypothetical protein